MKDINVILGERIKLARKTNKLTRERLAEMIEVSPRFLAEVESGKVGVALQTLKNISVALSITSDYLLGLDNESKPSSINLTYNKLTKVDDKYYPLLSAIINELEIIDK